MNSSSLLEAISVMLTAASPEELDEKLKQMRRRHAQNPDSESLSALEAIAAVVREKLALAREVDELARFDHETGLPTRRAFDERLELELRRSARSRTSFALVIIDVEGGGASRLRTMATAVARHVRLVDFAARFDTSQIAMILVDVDHATMTAIVERVVQALKGTGGGLKYGSTLSFPVDTSATIVERADAALYETRFS